MVSACCAAIELSARSVKRVVNVWKLLKIIWHRADQDGEPDARVKRAVLLLLALAAHSPEAMRDLLDGLSEACRGGVRIALGTWLRAAARNHAATPVAGMHWATLQAALQQQLSNLNAVSVNTLRLSECNLVRPFSFLGDIGTAPDEFVRDGARARRPKVQTPP